MIGDFNVDAKAQYSA